MGNRFGSKGSQYREMAAEMTVLWNDTVMLEKEVTCGTSFSIGEEFSCDFPVPKEVLGGKSRFEMLSWRAGKPMLRWPSTGDGAGLMGERAGVDSVALSEQKTRVAIGSWRFEAMLVRPSGPFRAPWRMDRRLNAYLGGAALLHLVFLLMIGLVPASSNGMILSDFDENSRWGKFLIEVSARPAPMSMRHEAKVVGKEAGGKAGGAHEGSSGKMGQRHARSVNKRFARRGHGSFERPAMSRADLKTMAANTGIVAMLGSGVASSVDINGLVATGEAPENVLGGLLGDEVGPSFGLGGLGVLGAGRGGGGTNNLGIGVGALRTLGVGTGNERNHDGYGAGRGHLGGRRTHSPVVAGVADVAGSLSRETIRRQVRRHLNEVRFCYEKQLSSRPDLSGRISVQFMIGRTGVVRTAAVASSTVGNAHLERCIVNAVRRWSFPQPKRGGVVMVTYPFVLQSAK